MLTLFLSVGDGNAVFMESVRFGRKGLEKGEQLNADELNSAVYVDRYM